MKAAKPKLSEREILYQAIFIIVLVSVLAGFAWQAHINLEAQHLTSGFSFLWRATGWDIGYSILPFTIRDPYWWTILSGFVNTVVVGLIGTAFATVLGLVVASMRIYGNPVINGIAKTYIELVRNLPPLLQLFAWYGLFTALPPPRQALQPVSSVFLSARGIFLPTLHVHWISILVLTGCVLFIVGFICWVVFSVKLSFIPARKKIAWTIVAALSSAVVAALAILLGATTPLNEIVDLPANAGLNIRGGLQLPPELAAIVFSTIFYGGAYAAEIIRGGFMAVDPGKIEAGKALGLTGWVIFARIQIPLVVANIIPMMTNLYVWLVKATTLGIAIGFADLFMVSVSAINQSGQTLELLALLAGGFWVLNSLIVVAMKRVGLSLKYWEAR